MTNTLIVAWDFSEVAENALTYANLIAKRTNSDIYLVNVVKSESEVESTLVKLEASIEKIGDLNLKPKVVVGSLYKSINSAALELDAKMVVMGTHGAVGMQKILGSKAIKVITGSSIPYLVTQGPIQVNNEFLKITFPIDEYPETKEKLKIALEIQKYFNSEFDIITQKSSVDVSIRNVKINTNFIRGYFDERGIKYSITEAKTTNLLNEVPVFAEEKKSDLIIIVTSKIIMATDYFGGVAEQEILTNEKNIPVLCVSPRKDLIKYGKFN